jgi:hypothetical protein
MYVCVRVCLYKKVRRSRKAGKQYDILDADVPFKSLLKHIGGKIDQEVNLTEVRNIRNFGLLKRRGL